jgi:hypothetical protein
MCDPTVALLWPCACRPYNPSAQPVDTGEHQMLRKLFAWSHRSSSSPRPGHRPEIDELFHLRALEPGLAKFE